MYNCEWSLTYRRRRIEGTLFLLVLFFLLAPNPGFSKEKKQKKPKKEPILHSVS